MELRTGGNGMIIRTGLFAEYADLTSYWWTGYLTRNVLMVITFTLTDIAFMEDQLDIGQIKTPKY